MTVVATVLFTLFQLNYHYGWITPQTMDIAGRIEADRAR